MPSGRLHASSCSTYSCCRLRASRPDRRVLGLPGDSELRELLIDLEEDKAARAVVFGLLAEMERK